jgi:hypothetical protein
MAFNAGNIVSKLKIDTADFDKGLEGGKRRGKSASAEIAKGFVKAQIALEGFKVILNGVIKGVKIVANEMGKASNAAMDYEKSMTTLGIISEQYGMSAEEAKGAAESLAQELNLGVGQTAESLQRLFKSGLNIDQASELMKRFTNEAMTGKAAGMSLGGAVENLASMYQMEISTLGDRAGISENVSTLMQKEADLRGVQISQLDEAARNQLKYQAFIRLTNETMGSAEKFTGSLIDSKAKFRTMLERIQVTVGQGVNPALNFLYQTVLLPLGRFIESNIVPALEKFAFLMKLLFQGIPEGKFMALHKEGQELFGPKGAFGSKAAGLVMRIRNAMQDFAGIVLSIVKPAIAEIQTAFQGASEALMDTSLAFVEAQAEGEQGGSILQTLATIAAKAIAGFINVGVKLLGVVESVADWLRENRTEIENFIESVFSTIEAIRTWVKENQDIIKTILTVVGVVLGVIAVVQTVISIVSAVGAVIAALTSPIGIIIAVISLLAIAWNRNWGGIQDKVNAVVKFFQTKILPLIKLFINNLVEIFKTGWNVIKTVFNFIAGIVNWVWSNVLEPVFKLIFAIVSRLVVTYFKMLKDGISRIVKFVKGAFALFKKYIINPIRSAWNFVMEKTEGIRSDIKDKFNKVVEFLKGLKDKIVDAIVQPFKKAKEKVEKWASQIKDSADKINPFHKESPSLVENVQAGVEEIMRAYSNLQGVSFPSANVALTGAISSGQISTTTGSMASGGVAGGGGGAKNVTLNIDHFWGDPVSRRQLVEDLKSEMNRTDRATGR